ncbi:MAG: DUF2029 domain-containing protein [Acidobacteria bacterium]|nr:DUF2029 domain-containing protein [Acidobacteriota bacterium]
MPTFDSSSRKVYTLIAVLAAAHAVVVARQIMSAPADVGWDLHVTCRGLEAIHRGADPYVGGAGPFFFPYLFHVAWISAPLCTLSPEGSLAYLWIYLGVVVGSVVLLARALGVEWREAALLGAVAPWLLTVAYWLAWTGNVTVLEVPLAAAVVVFFHQRRHLLSSATLGAMATFKLLPVVGLLAFPLVLTKRERPARAVLAGVATFAVIVLGSLALMGSARPSYFTQLVGDLPNQHSASGEVGGPTDPNLVEFLVQLAAALGLSHPNIPVTAIALLFLFLGASLMALRQSGIEQDSLWRTRLFCAAFIAITLALFRLKPYAFVTLVPFLLVCWMTAERRLNGVLLLTALLAAPFSATLPLPRVARILRVPAPYLTHISAAGRLVQQYSQLCGLLIVFGAILVALRLEARQHPGVNGAGART